MSSEQLPSETGFQELKRMALMAAQKDHLFVSRDDLTALVECADAIKEWKDAPTSNDSFVAEHRMLAAIKAVEAL